MSFYIVYNSYGKAYNFIYEQLLKVQASLNNLDTHR